MNAPGRVLVWICAAVVALPLSSCAFFASTYCQHEAQASEPRATVPQATVPIAQTSDRPCCAQQSSESAKQPLQPHREKPCQGECCLLSPFAQTGEKLVLASPLPALLAVLPHFDGTPSGDAVFLTNAAPQPLSLHILHCQWRC